MCRTAAAVASAGGDVIDASTPGWIPSKDSVKKLENFIGKLGLSESDTLVLDIWSNSAYMGTDEIGLPCRSIKVEGRYHVIGHLQAAPKTVFQNGLAAVQPILDCAKNSNIVLVAPIPRYVVAKCCMDPSHICNFGKDDYEDEFYRASEQAENVAGSAGIDFSFLRINEIFGVSDSSLSELRTAGGGSVWQAEDPVHLSADAYKEIGSAILTSNGGVEAPARPAKRPRLESVIPSHTGGAGGRGIRGNVRAPLWITGQASLPPPSPVWRGQRFFSRPLRGRGWGPGRAYGAIGGGRGGWARGRGRGARRN